MTLHFRIPKFCCPVNSALILEEAVGNDELVSEQDKLNILPCVAFMPVVILRADTQTSLNLCNKTECQRESLSKPHLKAKQVKKSLPKRLGLSPQNTERTSVKNHPYSHPLVGMWVCLCLRWEERFDKIFFAERLRDKNFQEVLP